MSTLNLPAPFEPNGDHIAIDLRGARALFTTRRGGQSQGPYASLNLGIMTDDDPAAVAANRAAIAEAHGVALAHGIQVHEARVQRRPAANPPGSEPEPADGQATATPGVAPIVLGADCLTIPISAAGAVAVVHAGWRGLRAGVIAEGVRAVRELGGTGPLSAAIGPGAGVCCYEVGEEVHAEFADYGDGARQARNLDLKAIAAAQLTAAGVAEVHDVRLCTMCRPEFFSHRRDRGVTGRQAALAWLQG